MAIKRSITIVGALESAQEMPCTNDLEFSEVMRNLSIIEMFQRDIAAELEDMRLAHANLTEKIASYNAAKTAQYDDL
jgi:hypothetical protein